ncbi:MAG: hypothetical protein IJ368_00080, partial [Oscillospiraceae bacterium]|nr:hypothetical protein [Oscillospiraceae bacterium]
MKKTLALIASVAMLALCTGCGSTKNTEATTTAATTASETTASEAAEAETTAAETTAAAEEAETTASETEAQSEAEEITEEDVDISNIVNADELQAVLDSRADGLWAVDIGNKISEWPNNVVITLEYEDEEDMSVIAKVHTLGDRFRM